MNNNVIIVGAGAAGLMAAGTAAQQGASVRLLDTNGFAGKKLNITGKGRCNITNDCIRDQFMDSIPQNGRFLFSAFDAMSPQMLMSLLEELGVPLKVERGRRVFPVSDRARDITDALVRWCQGMGVRVEKQHVTALVLQDGAVQGVKTVDGKTLSCDRVVLATGGLSYPLTGSTGVGYQLAAMAGHTITPTAPSLVPLLIADTCCQEMQGLSLKNVTLTVVGPARKTVFSELGEMLFTHEGVSGPLVLSASAHMRQSGAYQLLIDLKPGLDEAQLETRILRDFAVAQNKNIDNVLGALLPRVMIPIVLSRIQVSPETKVNAVTRKQREDLRKTVKCFPLPVAGFAPIEQAVVTAGGVAIKQVDPKTMQSKLVKGLYFAGELLDVDGYTGGYNLQIAWSTGYLAGLAAGKQ